jgi:deoxyribonuclease V
MRCQKLHDWDVTPDEAEGVQLSLASRVRRSLESASRLQPATLAGAVVSAEAAAVAVLGTSDLEVMEARRVEHSGPSPGRMRYRPGLMAFAYGPPLLRAFELVESRVDVVMFRAHGIAHPRRLGLAAHLGLLLETPSLGCADRALCGEHAPPGAERGDWVEVTDGDEAIGACVRTRRGARPLIVSPGYALNLYNAVEVVLSTSREHRMPEPLRQARRIARGG